MITSAPNPPWKWLRVPNKKFDNAGLTTPWADTGDGEILTHRSWISLHLIIQWIKEHRTEGKKPVVFIPDYYCYDTIFQVADEIEAVYYPVKRNLQPDMKGCRAMVKEKAPDAIIFCHFFGIYLSINDMNVLAKQCGAILIEDAVHMLYCREVGKNSDFILFSPWKLLGLPDGAILIVGRKNTCDENHAELCRWFEKKQLQYDRFDGPIKKWKLKKILQKFLPNVRKGVLNDLNADFKCAPMREKLLQISWYSDRILLQLTREQLLEIGERRKENLMYLNEFCSRKFKLQSQYDFKEAIPYVAVYDVSGANIADVCRAFGKIGKVFFRWPSLAPDILETSIARTLYTNSIMLSIHQELSPNQLSWYFKDKAKKLTDKSIQICQIKEEEYRTYEEQIESYLPLLQSHIWGRVKSEVQKWSVQYCTVKRNGKIIACFMTLQKNKLIKITRINQGILWIEDADFEGREKVYQAIAAYYTGLGKLLFWAPGERRTGHNMRMFIRNGFHYRKSYNATGYIELKREEAFLRKNLNSKWRNQLKKAESAGVNVRKVVMHEDLEKLLPLHIEHKKVANYDDSGDKITIALVYEGVITAYIAEKDQEIIGFVMVVKHMKNATYYIGWNNENGYRLDVNKLLLWRALLDLKSDGIRWFDLGGIDKIYTANISDFKLGMGCEYFESVGEFIKY